MYITNNIFDRRSPHGICRIQKRKESDVTYGGVLIHYGIPGQRWGFRRFQNEDRTLTEEGKARYRKESREEKKARKAEEKANRKAAKEAAKPESSKWKANEAAYLSDEELNRRNSRLQREQQYRNMTESRGHKFIKGFGKAMNKIFIASLIGVVGGVVSKNYKTAIDSGINFLSNGDWMNVKLDNLR